MNNTVEASRNILPIFPQPLFTELPVGVSQHVVSMKRHIQSIIVETVDQIETTWS
jgi:hypothetical protein